jgi:carboxyl-terminal processing protease
VVAGPAPTTGRAFEKLVHNDKRSAENSAIGFRNAITDLFGNKARDGEPLSALNLNTVYVLTTGSTCSASESFINALRGIDVQVVLIGGITCGKPYGFTQTNNCTRSYFALEFEGRNNKDIVVPVSGMAPTCASRDDFDHALGDSNESMLKTAFFYRGTGVCPTPAFSISADQTLSPVLRLRNPNALNADMEFMTRPTDSAKLLRPAK